jgi:aspartate racemase
MGLKPGDGIGLMGTEGTLRSGFYVERLRRAGYRVLVPCDDIQATLSAAIRAIKAGDLDQGRALAVAAALRLADRGADAILLRCTELPVVLNNVSTTRLCLDATRALAMSCVRYARTNTLDRCSVRSSGRGWVVC